MASRKNTLAERPGLGVGMFLLFVALCEGLLIGLRPLTALAILSWAIRAGALPQPVWPLEQAGTLWSAVLLTALALAELLFDKLSSTRCRRTPAQLALRLVVGAVAGALLRSPQEPVFAYVLLGIGGATFGTYGGSTARRTLARELGGDLPIAFLEDAVAIFGSLMVLSETCYR